MRKQGKRTREFATVEVRNRRSVMATKKSKGIYKPRLRTQRLEFLEYAATTRFEPAIEMTQEWWKLNVKGWHNTVPLKCAVCNHEVCPKFDNFFRESSPQRGAANCRCSKHGRWNSEVARVELLEMLSATRFVPHGFLLSSQAYAEQHVDARTVLPIQCKQCQHMPARCPLQHFVSFRSAECLCKNKTQRLVHDWISSEFSRIEPGFARVSAEVHFKDVRSDNGKAMPYDIVVSHSKGRKVVLIIEVDGRQHFTPDMAGMADFVALQARDLAKEVTAIERGIPMIRLHQPTVWAGSFDWKSFLSPLLCKVHQGTLPLRVYRQPGEASYWKGRYRELRVGSIVEM